MRLLAALRAWVDDRKREQRIRDLRFDLSVAHICGHFGTVNRIAKEMFAECDARSPRQVARMEKRFLESLDPHARAAIGK